MRRQTAWAALVACALLLPGCGGEETEDTVVDAVPSSARGYLHLDRDSDDWREAREALARVPALEAALLDALTGAVEVSGDGEAGVALVPKPVVVKPHDEPVAGPLDELAEYRDLLDGLPHERFVHGYLARAGARSLQSIDRTVRAAAAAADLGGGNMRIRVRARHDAEPGECSAGRGGDELLDAADPGAALYLEVPSIGCAIRGLAGRFGGVGTALGRFGRAAERRGDVSLEKDLLPLLDRRGALIASLPDGVPTLTLVVDGIEEEAALDVLSRLQPALIHLLRTEELGQAASFGSAEVEGITAATAQIAPGLELSYAAWDGRLVVSTALDGIRAVRRAEGLPGTEGFDAVLEDRPSERSALLFLDLDQLLTLGEQAGLAEDPSYLAVRDDLQKLRAAGAVLSREGEFTTAELTFQIP